MASRELQGWLPDPFGLHEMRYFSVGRPTKLVRDGRVDAYDEPPDDRSPVGAGTGAQASAIEDAQTPAVRTELPAATRAVADSAMAATAALPATRTVMVSGMPAAYLGPGAAQSPVVLRRRRRMEYAFVATGAVVAVLVFVALGGGGGPRKPVIAPAAFVTKAAQQTLAEHTADYTLSATARVSGQTLSMGGSGQIDLATDAMSFNIGASTVGGSFTEHELEVGGNLYLEVNVNGRIQALPGGRHWIEVPFAPSQGQSLATASPGSSLALLSQQGAHVKQLGTRSIGGQNCTGYSATPSRQAMLAAARQEYAKAGISTADTTAALQTLQSVQPPTITVWFDQQTDLACQESFSMQFGTPTSSGTDGVTAQLTFTHYGVPVNITAPAPSDTVSLQQYLRTTPHG